MELRPIKRRRRFKQVLPLKERLLLAAAVARERAASLPPGLEHERLLRQARMAKIAADLDGWISSPGLLPPT
jgi:hypothetical protein